MFGTAVLFLNIAGCFISLLLFRQSACLLVISTPLHFIITITTNGVANRLPSSCGGHSVEAA